MNGNRVGGTSYVLVDFVTANAAGASAETRVVDIFDSRSIRYAVSRASPGKLCGPSNTCSLKFSPAPYSSYTSWVAFNVAGNDAHSGKIVSAVPATTITGRGASIASHT